MLLGKLAGAMLASLSQAVYLLNAPLAQAARLAGALQAKAEEDPSILGGGAGWEPAAAADEPAAPAPVEDAPAPEATPEAAAEESDRGVPAETAETAEGHHPVSQAADQPRPDPGPRPHPVPRHHQRKVQPSWRSSAPPSSSTASRR